MPAQRHFPIDVGWPFGSLSHTCCVYAKRLVTNSVSTARKRTLSCTNTTNKYVRLYIWTYIQTTEQTHTQRRLRNPTKQIGVVCCTGHLSHYNRRPAAVSWVGCAPAHAGDSQPRRERTPVESALAQVTVQAELLSKAPTFRRGLGVARYGQIDKPRTKRRSRQRTRARTTIALPAQLGAVCSCGLIRMFNGPAATSIGRTGQRFRTFRRSRFPLRKS